MADPFQSMSTGFDSPARGAAAVTPNDSADLATTSRGIYIGAGGDVVVTTVYGHTVTFKAVPQGIILPVCASRILATGTTATNLLALF